MIRRIKPKDMAMIASWFKARKLPEPMWHQLSETGYIADERVAGWLLCTNSSVAMIEALISDPHTVPSLRKESMRKLAGFLIDTALLLGYSNIVCASKHPSVDKMAKSLGFKETDLKFYVLNDGEGEDNYRYLMENSREDEDY